MRSRQQQMAEAEELLADRLAEIGFARGLFFREFLTDKLVPYPARVDDDTAKRIESLRSFCEAEIDPVAIDRDARIPDSVVTGLGKLGILGACLPREAGGSALSQTAYCRLIEVLGGHCASTALFVNAHHSIGPRALVLFGTHEQQVRWLPKLATGEWISAFALTEPEAGSDAANVQTRAEPTADGSGFKITGEKRWITNGSLAHVLTLMARTPVPGSDQSKITAFIVTPDMPGFEVTEARMEKCGVRGTATSRLRFQEMFVPRENVLGKLGQGLKIALTTLDFGRTTFGASCTGAAKFCIERAAQHVQRRVQFDQPLASFELVKEKLAYMHAGTYAMEAVTYQTAAFIDSGKGDYILETAMLKVFSTDVLWRIINDTFQLHGGLAYFNDQPFERMMRDARINMIGEGANDVFGAFSALVGMRDVGLDLQRVLKSLTRPVRGWRAIARYTARRGKMAMGGGRITVRHSVLQSDARKLRRTIAKFGSSVERLLRKYREGIVDEQYQLARAADAATELYVSACVLRRMEAELDAAENDPQALKAIEAGLAAGSYYIRSARRRIVHSLYEMNVNDDPYISSTADDLLRRFPV